MTAGSYFMKQFSSRLALMLVTVSAAGLAQAPKTQDLKVWRQKLYGATYPAPGSADDAVISGTRGYGRRLMNRSKHARAA